MPQYVIYINDTYRYITDVTTGLRARMGMRENGYVVDKELIASGFSFDEGVGWDCVERDKHEAYSQIRWGIRDSVVCIDVDITSTGFNGAEGVDWSTVRSVALSS